MSKEQKKKQILNWRLSVLKMFSSAPTGTFTNMKVGNGRIFYFEIWYLDSLDWIQESNHYRGPVKDDVKGSVLFLF